MRVSVSGAICFDDGVVACRDLIADNERWHSIGIGGKGIETAGICTHCVTTQFFAVAIDGVHVAAPGLLVTTIMA